MGWWYWENDDGWNADNGINDDVLNVFGRSEKPGIWEEKMLNVDEIWFIRYWNDIGNWCSVCGWWRWRNTIVTWLTKCWAWNYGWKEDLTFVEVRAWYLVVCHTVRKKKLKKWKNMMKIIGVWTYIVIGRMVVKGTR